jgi:polysaccharide pyruvyl transferase CsaB
MTPKRAFLIGYYGMDNLGDDAIKDAIERAGEENGVVVQHYAVRRGPSSPDPRAVRLRDRRLWRAYLRALRQADLVLIGGGGLLKDQDRRATRGYGFLAEMAASALIARALRKPVALVGVGVGPIYARPGGALIALIAALARPRVVRDEQSADALMSLGVGKAEVFADPVFSLRQSPNGSADSVAPRAWPPKRVVISARSWYMMAADPSGSQDQLNRSLARLADEAIERGSEVRFACLAWPKDQLVAADIKALMRHGDQTAIPDDGGDWRHLMDELREADVIVAMRYHALVLAIVTGTPAVALAYEPKLMSLAEESGIPMVDVNDPQQVEQIPAELGAMVQADGYPLSERSLEELAERLGLSARQGLQAALSA